jgi:DNA-binding NtrC family response regulator
MADNKADILIVDDQKSICYSLERFLRTEGYAVHSAQSGEKALALLKTHEPRVVIMDIRMPEQDGLEILTIIRESYPKVQTIMMTAYSTAEQTIEAIKLGAYDYLIKPFENDELLSLIHDALKTRTVMDGVVTCDGWNDHDSAEKIIGKSPEMLSIFKQIGKIAPTEVPVLIQGESGTGKELIARAIYNHSKRADRRFLAVNCAAIPENLLESELFGYERGAFTGADTRRLGKIEQCQGGTLFLDEIGDLPLSIQAKLLRVLQDGTFQRLGGGETIKTDFRLLSATNQELPQLVTNNRFRDDLYYRINAVTINVPPLRERQRDLPDLINYFIRRYRKILNKNIKGVSEKTIRIFEQYSWPGNVRELENLIHKSVILCKSEYLCIDCCMDLRVSGADSCASLTETIDALVALAFRECLQGKFQAIISQIETAMIKRSLETTGGNQVRAAKLLSISRNTLRKKSMPTSSETNF